MANIKIVIEKKSADQLSLDTRVQCIKNLRNATKNLSLKEAKDLIDTYSQGFPVGVHVQADTNDEIKSIVDAIVRGGIDVASHDTLSPFRHVEMGTDTSSLSSQLMSVIRAAIELDNGELADDLLEVYTRHYETL